MSALARLLSTLLCLCASSLALAATNYQIGRGIADCTGLAGEGALYGYGKPDQDARGIHMRQYSRAFVISDGSKKVAISISDVTMITTEVQLEVIKRLRSLYGDEYTEQNVMLTAQHSHSTPGGYHGYELYAIPAGGFINETFEALVSGIIKAIKKAHDDLKPGKIFFNQGKVTNTTVNRSVPAYMNNPAEERAKYADQVDNDMVLLKFTDNNDANLGTISFFPVHTTSLQISNHLISSDNKGYAAQMFERSMNQGKFPGEGDFVAAFAQKAEADASPNTRGGICSDTGEACDYLTSTCGIDRDPETCQSQGPGKDMFDSLRIAGQGQLQVAQQLYGSANTLVDGPVDSRHQYVNFTNIQMVVDGKQVSTCKPAVGFSFAAGAMDGPGAWPFYQGNTEGDPEIEALRDDLFGVPSEEIKQCHAPKPVLIQTGELRVNDTDNFWQPDIVPIQIVRVGELVLLGVGAEVTTMAGRRLSESVRQVLTANGYPANTNVVVVSLTNCFSHYVTTTEEYAIQRYEGGCTLYGPYTLNGYIQKFGELASAMAKGESSDKGPTPPSLRDKVDPALGDILTDIAPGGTTFGDVLINAAAQYNRGSTASVTFVGGNPRNGLMTDQTFLEIERRLKDGSWIAQYRDSHWETRFEWDRPCAGDVDCDGVTQQESNITVRWDIAENEALGTYRIRHIGNRRDAAGNVYGYTGVSTEFEVV